MATERLSKLQKQILVWLAEDWQKTKGTRTADHGELTTALAYDKGNISHSLRTLESKGLVSITRTPGRKAESLSLTLEGHQLVARLS